MTSWRRLPSCNSRRASVNAKRNARMPGRMQRPGIFFVGPRRALCERRDCTARPAVLARSDENRRVCASRGLRAGIGERMAAAFCASDARAVRRGRDCSASPTLFARSGKNRRICASRGLSAGIGKAPPCDGVPRRKSRRAMACRDIFRARTTWQDAPYNASDGVNTEERPPCARAYGLLPAQAASLERIPADTPAGIGR